MLCTNLAKCTLFSSDLNSFGVNQSLFLVAFSYLDSLSVMLHFESIVVLLCTFPEQPLLVLGECMRNSVAWLDVPMKKLSACLSRL